MSLQDKLLIKKLQLEMQVKAQKAEAEKKMLGQRAKEAAKEKKILTQKVKEAEKKTALKLHKKMKFSIEQIAGFMEISTDNVKELLG